MVKLDARATVSEGADPAPPARFPVVGFGASAGGVEPTKRFLAALGSAPGVAVVIVHHLPVSTHSHLVEILSRSSELPVVAATDGCALESNHVYVISPEVDLVVSGGVLGTVARSTTHGQHLPIDRFFEALAADLPGLCVGIVASGTGYDGTAGVRAIKSAAGIAMAQDESAQHSSMPRNAMSTGGIDFVLPPAELAREVLRFAEHCRELGAAGSDLQAERSADEIIKLVQRKFGIPFGGYRRPTLRDRLDRRMAIRGVRDLRAYTELLRREPAELERLREDLLVRVTSFFRDPEVFDALRRLVLPRLLERRSPHVPLRIWVPACATGEEAYGLAIIVLEYFATLRRPAPPLQIYATDICAAAIEKARTGSYPESIAREVSPERLVAYFLHDGGGYRVNAQVRSLCVFGTHDITSDSPLLHMDLISCRNLLTYLDSELRDRVATLLHHALREPGFLLLGNAETLQGVPGLVLVDEHPIYERTSAAPRREVDFPVPVATVVRPPAPTRRSEARTGSASVASMRQNLESVVEQLEATNHELRAANEQWSSTNEELRSTNDELQSAKQELLAANEELRTVNSEMSSLNAASARLTDDLANVLACSGVPIVLVNREGVIRRLTPAAREALGATALDLGRPVESVAAIAEMFPNIREQIADVVERLTPFTGTIRSPAGRWFQCTIRPYVRGDRQVDGVVITAHDIHEVRRSAEELDEARRHAESVLDTVHGALIVVGHDFAVHSVNRRFVELFGLSPREVERKRMDELGVEVLAAPALITMLQTLDAAHPAGEVGLVQSDQELGRRLFQANARRIEGTELALVAIEDVTAREQAQLAVRRAELGFREMLMAAGEAIIMTDPDRRPFFANRAAGELFGYATDEILAGPLDRLLPALDVTSLAGGPASASFPRPDSVGRRKDGSEFLAQVGVSHAVREQQPAIVVFVTDVTQERESQKRIREYQEMLQRKAFDAALAEEHERRRLAVALHDRVGQLLALAKMKLASAGDGASDTERANVDQASRILEEAIAETRALTFDLSPPVLYDLGLKAAVQWLVEDFATKFGLEVELVDDGADLPLDEVTSSVIFRSIRELLMNAVKHANVKEARLSFSRKGDRLVVEIVDGGVGFETATERIAEEAGFGLLSIRQQVTGLGGVVAVESEPGHGARVTLQVPLHHPDEPNAADRSTEPS